MEFPPDKLKSCKAVQELRQSLLEFDELHRTILELCYGERLYGGKAGTGNDSTKKSSTSVITYQQNVEKQTSGNNVSEVDKVEQGNFEDVSTNVTPTDINLLCAFRGEVARTPRIVSGRDDTKPFPHRSITKKDPKVLSFHKSVPCSCSNKRCTPMKIQPPKGWNDPPQETISIVTPRCTLHEPEPPPPPPQIQRRTKDKFSGHKPISIDNEIVEASKRKGFQSEPVKSKVQRYKDSHSHKYSTDYEKAKTEPFPYTYEISRSKSPNEYQSQSCYDQEKSGSIATKSEGFPCTCKQSRIQCHQDNLTQTYFTEEEKREAATEMTNEFLCACEIMRDQSSQVHDSQICPTCKQEELFVSSGDDQESSCSCGKGEFVFSSNKESSCTCSSNDPSCPCSKAKVHEVSCPRSKKLPCKKSEKKAVELVPTCRTCRLRKKILGRILDKTRPPCTCGKTQPTFSSMSNKTQRSLGSVLDKEQLSCTCGKTQRLLSSVSNKTQHSLGSVLDKVQPSFTCGKMQRPLSSVLDKEQLPCNCGKRQRPLGSVSNKTQRSLGSVLDKKQGSSGSALYTAPSDQKDETCTCTKKEESNSYVAEQTTCICNEKELPCPCTQRISPFHRSKNQTTFAFGEQEHVVCPCQQKKLPCPCSQKKDPTGRLIPDPSWKRNVGCFRACYDRIVCCCDCLCAPISRVPVQECS